MNVGSLDLRRQAAVWYGTAPADWRVERFKRVATIRNGQVDPEDERYKDLPLFAPNHIEPGTGRLLGVESADAQGAESGKYLVEEGEVVYSKIRPALRKVTVAPCRGLCSADMYPIRPAKHVHGRFLFYAMLGEGFSRYALLESDRVAMPKINREALGECVFTCPGLERQCAIAAFLDRKTAAIDALIAKKERLIELLQEKRQALITQAVTKGLDGGVKMKESGVAAIGRIPAHWVVKRLKHISPAQTVGVVVNPSSYYADEGVPFLFGGNVRDGMFLLDNVRRISAESNRVLRKSMLRAGDLVTVRVGYPGVTAVIPPSLDGCNCASMMIVRRSARFSSEWLCLVMNSVVGRQQVEIVQYGAAQEQFNISRAVDFAFPCPPLDEQVTIARTLGSQTRSLTAVVSAIQSHIEKLREYRQALITAAVTGQIDVPEHAA